MFLSNPSGLTVSQLVERYDTRSPRYTSYPTATRFTPAVGAGHAGAWLKAAPLERSVSLYLHIPFCKRLCWYCGCNTRAMNRRELISSYVKLLLREADLVLAQVGRAVRVGSIHLGGGTPNMLSPTDLEQLFEGLSARFDLRRFHSAILDNGPLPLALLEQQVELWLGAAMRTSSAPPVAN